MLWLQNKYTIMPWLQNKIGHYAMVTKQINHYSMAVKPKEHYAMTSKQINQYAMVSFLPICNSSNSSKWLYRALQKIFKYFKPPFPAVTISCRYHFTKVRINLCQFKSDLVKISPFQKRNYSFIEKWKQHENRFSKFMFLN